MLEIEEMDAQEIHALLSSVTFGHLGCSRHDEPYVVPLNFVWIEPNIYFYTTDGKKAETQK